MCGDLFADRTGRVCPRKKKDKFQVKQADIMLNAKQAKIIIIVTLVILIGAGLFLRFWNLGGPSFWVDEINAYYVGQSWADRGEFVFPSGHEYHRAMLYSIIAGTGFKLLDANETSTRMPAAIFGMLCIIMAYSLTRTIFSRKTAMWIVFLMVFSHFEIGWSRTARMYTMLQFFSLCIVYIFVRAYQGESRFHRLEFNKGFVKNSLDFLRAYMPFVLWLVAGLALCRFAAVTIHFIAYLLIGGLFLYLLWMALVQYFKNSGIQKWLNRHTVSAVVFALTGIVLYFFSPAVHHLITYFSEYIPAWAEGSATAQDRMLLFQFLISPYRFPLAAFFLLGILHLFLQFRERGFLPFFTLVWVMVFFSFISPYRVQAYFFFVYPLFLMFSAYGISALLDMELKPLQSIKPAQSFRFFGRQLSVRKTGALMIRIVVLLVFIAMPWFRISLHIPFNEDGITNMAVTPYEWREASRKVSNAAREGDVILSGLPQITQYYGVKADYTFNWSALNLARFQGLRNDAGQYIDVYAGIPCIGDLGSLKNIVKQNRRGWCIVARYYLENTMYIPKDIRAFLEEHTELYTRTKNGTVQIYHWDNEGRTG